MPRVNVDTRSKRNCSLLGKKESLKYQLELLRDEISLINKGIERADNMTKAIRNWSLIVMGGSIAFLLKEDDLRKYVIGTSFFPLLFWYVESWWRRYVHQFLYRQRKISEFVNEKVGISPGKAQNDNFRLLDPAGESYKEDEEYQERIKVGRIMRENGIWPFYVSLIMLATSLFLVLCWHDCAIQCYCLKN